MKGASMCGGGTHVVDPARRARPVGIALGGSKAVLSAAALVLLALRPAVGLEMCVGDCSADSQVTVDELITMVDVALGADGIGSCTAGDANTDSMIGIDEIVIGVNNALHGCAGPATPTPTPTVGSQPSYVGDYYGTAGSYGVRFHVDAGGSATGFLDFLSSGGAATRIGGAADVLATYEASGQANLATGSYQLSGEFFGNSFDFMGQLPATSSATGTLHVVVPVLEVTADGTLYAGTPASPTPTPAIGCDSANLQMTFANVSADFNGNASNFVVARMNTAVEQQAPDYIPGLHEVYNALFNGTECGPQGQVLRNLQISLFQAPGGLAAGQSFPVGSTQGLAANVYYGQATAGGESVWSSSTGTVFIDSVNGSVVTLRVVGAAMTETAGAATGSFTLDVSGQVNNFTRQ
jgi:hypothetical protein